MDWVTTRAGALSAAGHARHFGDPAAEAAALSAGCALWPRQGWCLHTLEGERRVDFLHDYLTQEVRREVGQGAYGCLLTVKGGLMGDLWVLLREADLLLLSAPDAGPSAVKHLKRYALLARVRVVERSELVALSLIGPEAPACAALLGASLPEADLDHVTWTRAGVELTLCRNEWLGVPGYDLIAPRSAAEALADELVAGGALLVGEDALTARRVATGLPLYGVDMHEKTLPLEAGLEERAISYSKGCYTGQEVVVRIKHRGKINRLLRGVSLGALPSELPQALFTPEGKEVSQLTSATPAGDGARGLAVIHRKYEVGSELRLGSPEGPAVGICELPFAD